MEFSLSGALSGEGFECESLDAGDVDMKLLSLKGSNKPKRVRLSIGDDVPLGRIHQWNIGMKMS